MTKVVDMENPPFFFLERLPTLVKSKIFDTSMGLHFEFWSMLEVIALIGTFDWSAKRTNESRCLEASILAFVQASKRGESIFNQSETSDG